MLTLTMITLFNLSVLLIISLNNAFDFTCPSNGHWKLRSESTCMHQRNYSCLYDVNLQVNMYREKCIRPRIVGPGYKYVLQPNPNRGSCNLARYQPFIFNTTGSSDCTYLKSHCNSEGQTTYTNGTTRSDKVCTCNTDIGYDFIRYPRNGCYCNPSREDCSCYIRTNTSNKQIVWKDSNCDDEKKTIRISSRRDMFDISGKIRNHNLDNYKYNINFIPTNEYRMKAAKWVLIVLLSYCGVGAILQGIMRRWLRARRNQEDTKTLQRRKDSKESITDVNTTFDVPNHKRANGDLTVLTSSKDILVNTNQRTFEMEEDPVPRHIRNQVRDEINQWERQYKNFICTESYTYVLRQIDSESCIAVTGSSGAGKTAIVRRVSLSLRQTSGYEIMTIITPQELRKYYIPGRKTLFVMDDVCGKFTANVEQIHGWAAIKSVVDLVLNDKTCKILFSCRLQVYQDPLFTELNPFKPCECNITSDNLCLAEGEKRAIFEYYSRTKSIKDDILSRRIDNFPLLCQLVSIGKSGPDIDNFFARPSAVYEKELEVLKIDGKIKFGSLCLCILFNNQLKEEYFKKQTDKFLKIIEDTCRYIGLNTGTSAMLFDYELNTLKNTYINKHNGFYKICHDYVFDYMANYFGEMMQQCFIDHADSGLLGERFLWKKTDNQTDEYLRDKMVNIQDEYLEPYIKRMISDWTEGHISDVFYSVNMKNHSFREKFLNQLNGIQIEQAEELSNMKEVLRKNCPSGNTPLICSSANDYANIVRWLLEHNADVNSQRDDRCSALYMACQNNSVDVVKILLEKDINVNLCTDEGVSPLSIACYKHGNDTIIHGLLEKNAEVNKGFFKANNMTPLFMACTNNFTSTVEKLLLKGADPNISLTNRMSALLIASQKEYTAIVRLLTHHNADVNAEMRDGDTPLFSASWMGFKEITEILLDKGADAEKCLHQKDIIQQSLVISSESFEIEKQEWHDAVVDYASPEVKKYILAQPIANDYVFDVFAGSSPLHVACFMGHIEICDLLIQRLPSVNKEKDDKTTPLFYACEVGHSAIVSLLLKKGADSSICRADGRSPKTIAFQNDHFEVLSLLDNKEKNIQD